MSPQVTIYCVPGCGRCLAARDWFRAQGVEPEMRDVSEDPQAQRAMLRAVKGARTVPVVQGLGQATLGFDPAFWRPLMAAGSQDHA